MKGYLMPLLSGKRMGQFLSVGIVGAIVDLIISIALTYATAISPTLAKFIGAETAIILMFLLNDRWTFADAGRAGVVFKLRRLLKSNVVRGGGLAVQVTVVWLLTGTGIEIIVSGTDLWPAVTMPIAIACSFVFNYVAETLFTWRLGG